MNIYPITLGSLLIIINILIGWFIIKIGWFIIKTSSEDAEKLKRLEEKYKNSDKDYEENSKKYDTWTEEISKESFKARNKKYLEVRKNDTFFSYVYFVLSIIIIIILISGIYLIYYGITNKYISYIDSQIFGILLLIIAVLYIPIGHVIAIGHTQNQYVELTKGIIAPSIFLVFFISSIYLLSINSNNITPNTTPTITTNTIPTISTNATPTITTTEL